MIKAQTNADDPSFKDETDFKMCTDVTGSVCPVPPEFGTSYKPNAGTVSNYKNQRAYLAIPVSDIKGLMILKNSHASSRPTALSK